MRTIGIDPGIERVGVGIVESEGSKLQLVHAELIKTSAELSIPERLGLIFSGLEQIIKTFQVECASIEELFFAKNLKTVMNVAQARGVLLLALHRNNIPIYEYTPLQVKQSLVGYGRADKKQVQRMLTMLLGEKDLTRQDDVTDGIALAVTHINMSRMFSKIRGI